MRNPNKRSDFNVKGNREFYMFYEPNGCFDDDIYMACLWNFRSRRY